MFQKVTISESKYKTLIDTLGFPLSYSDSSEDDDDLSHHVKDIKEQVSRAQSNTLAIHSQVVSQDSVLKNISKTIKDSVPQSFTNGPGKSFLTPKKKKGRGLLEYLYFALLMDQKIKGCSMFSLKNQ